jgi:hypothetical protein
MNNEQLERITKDDQYNNWEKAKEWAASLGIEIVEADGLYHMKRNKKSLFAPCDRLYVVLFLIGFEAGREAHP